MAGFPALPRREWIQLVVVVVATIAVLVAAKAWPQHRAFIWGGFIGAVLVLLYARLREPVNYDSLKLSAEAIDYAAIGHHGVIMARDIKAVDFVREKELWDGGYLLTKWVIDAGGKRKIEVMDEWPDRGRLLRWFRRSLPDFDLAAAKAGLKARHEGRWACFPRVRYVDRLEVDEQGIRYTEFEPRTEGLAWNEVQRVLFYYGEPDFPDPLFGMAPIREWHVVRVDPEILSLHVPDAGDHSERLVQWCARKLPGFSADVAREAVSSAAEAHRLLWERNVSR